MSDNFADTATTHNVEANDDLVKSVIVDQTDNLEKGWREAFQNIIDSDALTGKLRFDHEHSLIADNGSGVELNRKKGTDLLTVLGESSKSADDHSTIGEFGVGTGQIIAKGISMFASGDTALFFDIKGWGLEAKTIPLKDASEFIRDHSSEMADLIDENFGETAYYQGLAVLVSHYEDEVPDEDSYKWDRFESRVKTRFQYLNSVDTTDLYLNGEKITDQDPLDVTAYGHPKHTETYESPETGKVHIGVRHGSGSLTVYSGGIKVCSVDSRGIQGNIVTQKNLRLNFARNEIKSGCPVWHGIEQRLNDIRVELFEDTERDLNDSARKFIADRMLNHDEIDEYSDLEVFETASEDVVSWSEIEERDEIGFAPQGNAAADKLEERGEIVLSQDDDASSKLGDELDELDDAPEEYDADERAEASGIHTSYETTDTDDLKPTQYKQLGVARYMVELLDDVDMDVYYGESDVANAWTDGRDEIHITDSATPSSSWIQWVPELWRVVMHEVAHQTPSNDEPGHGVSYNRRYRELFDGEGKDVLSAIMGKIDEENLTEIAERGHAVQIDEFATL